MNAMPLITVIACFMVSSALAMKPTTADIQAAISQSDKYAQHQDALIVATQKLVEANKCTLLQISKFRGWKQIGDKAMIQCGSYNSADQLATRWYLDLATGRLYQPDLKIKSESKQMPTPEISQEELNRGNTRSLKKVTLPWGENLFALLARKHWRLVVYRDGSPNDFYCDTSQCSLELHLVSDDSLGTTKKSCGLLFRFKFNIASQTFYPEEWRAKLIWAHNENELLPYFNDRYATYDCGLT